MCRGDQQIDGRNRLWQRSRKGAIPAGKRWIHIGVGLAFCLGCLLLLGLIFSRRHAAHPRAGVPLAAPPGPQTAFEAAFAQAQRCYLAAEIVTKQQLEALEEWDGDSIRGSAPEILRRSLIARTREIRLAEAAARGASRRARTSDERYRATRLLVHVERDRGNHQAELEQAKKLVALWPHDPQARLLLERAVKDSGVLPLAHREEGSH